MKINKITASVLAACICLGVGMKVEAAMVEDKSKEKSLTKVEAKATKKADAKDTKKAKKDAKNSKEAAKEAPATDTKPAAVDETKQPEAPVAPTEPAAPPTPVAPPAPKVELPYVLVNDDMSNLQLDNANKPVFDKYTILERRAQGLPTSFAKLQPYRNGKIAYLTFDDGPEGTHTPAILDILKAEGIKATFYVVGSYCYSYPETLKRMFNEGHAIGNHSYTHDYDVLYPNVYNFLDEMYKTEKAMKEIIGYRGLIVRAPGGTYGMFTSAYYPALASVGLVEHDWNVCIDDAVAGNPTAWDFVEKVRSQTASGISSAIVLMHCSYGKAETVRALPHIIKLLRERGYSFGVVTPMTPQPW